MSNADRADVLATAPAAAVKAVSALIIEWNRFGDWAQSSLELRQGAFVSEVADPEWSFEAFAA